MFKRSELLEMFTCALNHKTTKITEKEACQLISILESTGIVDPRDWLDEDIASGFTIGEEA